VFGAPRATSSGASGSADDDVRSVLSFGQRSARRGGLGLGLGGLGSGAPPGGKGRDATGNNGDDDDVSVGGAASGGEDQDDDAMFDDDDCIPLETDALARTDRQLGITSAAKPKAGARWRRRQATLAMATLRLLGPARNRRSATGTVQQPRT